MSKVKVLVVEDEVIIADDICDTLEDYGYDVTEPAISFTEALESIEEENPDIAILDVQLSGKKTGIDLARVINEKYKFPFIFLTSNSDKFTLNEAKEVQPYAFLVKPFSKEELYTSLEIALFNFSKQKEKVIDKENLVVKDALFIKNKQCFYRLNFKDILYIQSDNVYLDVHAVDGKKYTVRATLNDYILKLDDSFERVHRSYIVNLKHLDVINHISVTIKGEVIPIAKKYRDDLLDKLNKG